MKFKTERLESLKLQERSENISTPNTLTQSQEKGAHTSLNTYIGFPSQVLIYEVPNMRYLETSGRRQQREDPAPTRIWQISRSRQHYSHGPLACNGSLTYVASRRRQHQMLSRTSRCTAIREVGSRSAPYPWLDEGSYPQNRHVLP